MKKNKICPVCKKKEKVVTCFQDSIDKPLLDKIQTDQPKWNPDEGVCLKCLDQYHQQLLNHLLKVDGAEGYSVLPTPLRLNAHPDYNGEGVTICFIDSGFFLHPDLILPENRVKKLIDITQPDRSIDYFKIPHSNAWHGTMTSVVCAGNGYLSSGVYKGIANSANLVLLKVMDDEQKISESNIVKALQWVKKNHKKYKIRIVNLSVTGDESVSYKESNIDKETRLLYKAGVIVVAAVGNDATAKILPPANAPEVIAVGGLDDQNTLDPMQQGLYHSTYGYTIDGLTKPELIAPAIWLAAPILPKTSSAQQAVDFFIELEKGDNQEQTLKGIREHKFISAHYAFADGTSFAAPIICSIIAQMLEANPTLSPPMIREILLSTARPILSEEILRQGFGVVQAGHAVSKAIEETNHPWIRTNPIFDFENKKITFKFHHHTASKISLAGNFNEWNADQIQLLEQKDGEWKIEIEMLQAGFYNYKFIIDGYQWMTDPLNYYRQPDGFNSFNSSFYIKESAI